MKKIALLTALILLHGCSSSETAPEVAPLPHPDDAVAAASPAPEANLANDPFLAEDHNAVAASTTPSAAATDSQSVDSLLATPVEGGSGSVTANPSPESLSAPLPPAASAEPAPVPKVSLDHEVTPTPVMPAAKADPRKHDSYEEYKEYQRKEESRKALQNAYDDRSLFPHEDGAVQIGIDYARNAFPGYDFDPSAGVKHADTMGGVVSVNYFPLRSLSYGRLGIGVHYSIYWSKYEFLTTNTTLESSKVHSIDAFGSKAIYEFDYFLGQILVPWVFYGMDKVTVRPYSLSAGNVVYANYPKSTFNRHSYGGGAHLNLNRLEPVSASRGLANLGIRKTYLTYTFLTEASGGTGASHFLGLRFEY